MRYRTVLMFVLAVIAAIVWALRFVPSVAIDVNVLDFCGGFAIGTAIGGIIVWLGERPPKD